MSFEGFHTKHFEVFAIPDFSGRMAAIRSLIQPALSALAEEVAPELAASVGAEVFPHVARHMRRTVNPPEDTWVAFGPEKRGYKKRQHFKVAISRQCVRLLFEIGPDCAEKAAWARLWARDVGRLGPLLKRRPWLAWFKDEHDEAPAAPLGCLTDAEIGGLAKELTRRKDGQLVVGRRLDRPEVLRMTPEAFVRTALETFRALAPLYRLA